MLAKSLSTFSFFRFQRFALFLTILLPTFTYFRYSISLFLTNLVMGIVALLALTQKLQP